MPETDHTISSAVIMGKALGVAAASIKQCICITRDAGRKAALQDILDRIFAIVGTTEDEVLKR